MFWGFGCFFKTCFIPRLRSASFPADLANTTAWRQPSDTTASWTPNRSRHSPPRVAIPQKVRYFQMHRYASKVDANPPNLWVYRVLSDWDRWAQNLNFPATLRNMWGPPRTTEPCGLLAALGPGTSEPSAAHPASFGGRLAPPARPPASGLRERGPGRPPNTGPGREAGPGPPPRRPARAGQDRGEGGGGTAGRQASDRAR